MKLRKIQDGDLEIVKALIDSDDWHKGVLSADLFAKSEKGLTQFAIVEDDGRPVLFVTLEKMVRCYVQFDAAKPRRKTARAVLWLSGFLKETLPRTGVRELITDSHSSKLVAFMQRALGMKRLDGQTYTYKTV